jgi:hypothetical protein
LFNVSPSFTLIVQILDRTESGTFVVGDFKINQSGFSFPHESPPVQVETPPFESPNPFSGSTSRVTRPWRFENPFLDPTDSSSSVDEYEADSAQSSSASMSSSGGDDSSSDFTLPKVMRSRGSSEIREQIQVQDLEELRPMSNLGQGASGVVQRVLHLPTNQEFALKV